MHFDAEFKDEMSLLGIGPGREQGKFLAHHRLEVVRLDDGPQSREEFLPGLLRYQFRKGRTSLATAAEGDPDGCGLPGVCCLSQT